MGNLVRRAPAVVIFVSALTGCVGAIGAPGEGAGGGGGGRNDADAGNIIEGQPDPATCNVAASPAAMRLLTREEYEGTVSNMVGKSLALAKLLPLDAELRKDSPFTSNANVPMDETRRAAFEIAAETAADAVMGNLGAYVNCAGNITRDCAQGFANTMGRRAYRRPLTNEEVSSLMGIFDAVAADGSKEEALRFLFEAMLQSPQFLYHVEVGVPSEEANGRVPLTDYEVASRVAFFVTGEGPTDAMLDAAAAGEFATPEKVANQTRTLVESDKGRAHAVDQLLHWLRVNDVGSLEKSGTKFPSFTAAIRAAALEETTNFFRSEVFEKKSSLPEWFTTKRSYFGGALNDYYGTTANGTGDTNWGDAPRAGLLGQVSWLATFAGAESNIPTKRGKFVIEDLLCQTIPPPPAAAMLSPVAPPDDVSTTRQRFEEHGKNGCTKGCHDSMDGIGFAFEHFDATGHFQAKENNQTIDASGVMDVGTVKGGFQNAQDLDALITSTDQISTCFASRWYETAMARPFVTDDRCTIAKVSSAFVKGGSSFTELMVNITTSDGFRSREVCTQ